MAFNIFDFSNLGGNQLGKAVSNQKLPTVAPFNPWVQPTYSPTPKTTVWGEIQFNTQQPQQQSWGVYNFLKEQGANLYDFQQSQTPEVEAKKLKALLSMWVDLERAKSIILKSREQNQWITGRIKTAVAWRLQTWAESLATDKTIAEKGLSLAKDVASLPFDITGGIIAPVIEPVLKPVMESETVQGIASEYGKFREQNPRLAQNIEATVWLGTILAPWTKAGQQVIKVPWKVAKEWVKIVGKWVSKIPEAIGWVGEQWVSTVVGISREAQKTIKQTPELYKQARTWKITTGGELENFISATNKRLDDISELGKWYEKVRKWAVVSNADEISNIYLNTTKDTPTNQLTKADIKILGDASDYMSQLKWNVTDADLMALRRQLDSVVYDPNTWMKRKLSPQGSILIQKMRAEVDNIAKERIPWLKELDAKYAPEASLLRDIKSKIYDANGNLKENALSTISQVVGKNKAMRLDKFEQIYPQLWAKMRALKAFEEVQAISEIKTWSIARQLSWPVIWSAIAPWIGTIVWWIATNPNIVARILETYGMAKNKIKSLISKGKKITPQEAKEVHDIVKAIPKEEVEKIIAKTPTVKVSAIPAIWPITLWKHGKTTKRPVLQSPTAFEKGYTMSIKKPIVKKDIFDRLKSADAIASNLKRLWYEVEQTASKQSKSEYITVKKWDESFKIRISDHELPPTYWKIMWYADFEISPNMRQNAKWLLQEIEDKFSWITEKITLAEPDKFSKSKSDSIIYSQRLAKEELWNKLESMWIESKYKNLLFWKIKKTATKEEIIQALKIRWIRIV